ncbi:LTA synthase family protein [Liquorilactobacillus vini]|uniref:Arylsulfatase n=1 Tax=Liquorilactobacillus vini DSM 20605 TaxID=1133569 RepID=A0A0R2CMS4_9LACO|nr:LTA synthase family protein [Liquorilactobacillus vini]KRM89139.1 arylsulfatase [Liquorilactobacillus vini DSM 20605]
MQTKQIKRVRLFGLVIFGGVSFLLLNSLFWNAGSTVLSQATRPSFLYAAMNIARATTSLALPLVVLMLGFLLAKQRFSLKQLVQEWLYLVLFAAVWLLIALFVFQSDSLSNFFSAFLPMTRNAYPVISGIFLAQVLQPAFKQVLDQQPVKRVLTVFGLLAVLPTIFNADLFGFGSGNTVLFGCYLYLLGVALHYFLAAHPLPHSSKLWLIAAGSWLISVILNGLMPYISYAKAVSLATAGRFSNSASAVNLLVAVCLAIVFWQKFEPVASKLATVRLKKITDLILGALAVSDGYLLYSTIFNINNKWNSNHLGSIKLIFALAEAIIFPLLIWGLNGGLRWLTAKLLEPMSSWLQQQTLVGWLDQVVNLPQLFKKFWQKSRRQLLVFGWLYLVAAASMLIMNTSFQISPSTALTSNIFVYTFFIRFPVILLNVLLLTALLMILRFILFDNYWTALTITSLFYLIFSLISRSKLQIRDEPVLPSDLTMLKATFSLLGMVNLAVVIAGGAVVILALAVAIFCDRRHRVTRRSWRKRSIWLGISLLFLSGTFFLNHQKSPVQVMSSLLGNDPMFYNQPVGAQKNGAVLQFLNNVDVKVMDRPAGYSRAKMQQIARKYQKVAAQINQTRKNDPSQQTFIFTLSESFADPERVPQMTINKDPMPYLRNLKLKTTSGLMMSSGYGGGTANMEYMALTGFSMSNFSATLPTPYTQIVAKLKKAPAFNQSFNYSTAIHPYLGVYYNRQEVYQKFGFNRFYYLGSKYRIKHQHRIDRSQYLSDQTAYDNAIDQVNRKSGGQFINLITMQNHYPYDKNYYNSRGFSVSGRAVADADAKASAEDFATGVSYTDQYLKAFIKKLNQIKKPITLVWYGDHLPGIYSGDSMSKYGLLLHQTDYFIYSNKYARQHGMGISKNQSSKTNYVDPSDFIAMSLEQSNSKVSAYNALLTKIHQDLPAITVNSFNNGTNSYNSNAEFVNSHGNVVAYDSLSAKQKELYHDYQLVQYDITAGKQYLAKSSFMTKIK